MPLEGVQELPRLHIPHLDGLVHTPAHHTRPIHGHAVHRTRMPLEGVQELPRLHIPHLDGLVRTPAHHTSSECPSRVCKSSPVSTFHTLTVLSALPLTTRDPSMATLITNSECPSRVCKSSPVSTFHTL